MCKHIYSVEFKYDLTVSYRLPLLSFPGKEKIFSIKMSEVLIPHLRMELYVTIIFSKKHNFQVKIQCDYINLRWPFLREGRDGNEK